MVEQPGRFGREMRKRRAAAGLTLDALAALVAEHPSGEGLVEAGRDDGEGIWVMQLAADGDSWFRTLDRRQAMAAGAASLVSPGIGRSPLAEADGAGLLESARALFDEYRRIGQTVGPGFLARIGDTVAELVPELREVDRAAVRRTSDLAQVGNSTGEVHGTVDQGRDFTFSGPVINSPQAPVHTGRGDIVQNSPHFSGDGANYIAGDNQGGIRQRFGGSRRPRTTAGERSVHLLGLGRPCLRPHGKR